MIGIYKIENLIDHKKYIGQSVQIEKRWQKHKKAAFNSKDHSYNLPLYRAIRKYGLNNFSFEIIEECLCEELNEKEIFWIAKYDTFFNGYNMTLGGASGVGRKGSKDKVIGIIKDLETTSNTQKEIAQKWQTSEELVQGINTGRYWRHDRKYPIRESKFKPKEGKKRYFCIDCGKEISKGSLRCVDCENKHRTIPLDKMPITREELKNLIRIQSFTTIAKQYGISDNAIRRWCDKFNLPRKKSEIKKYTDEEWVNI